MKQSWCLRKQEEREGFVRRGRSPPKCQRNVQRCGEPYSLLQPRLVGSTARWKGRNPGDELLRALPRTVRRQLPSAASPPADISSSV